MVQTLIPPQAVRAVGRKTVVELREEGFAEADFAVVLCSWERSQPFLKKSCKTLQDGGLALTRRVQSRCYILEAAEPSDGERQNAEQAIESRKAEPTSQLDCTCSQTRYYWK
jgi:hypothetical protein